MSSSKPLKQIMIYALGSFLPALITLLSTAIFTRLLGADKFGRYSLVLGITMLVTAVSVQWLQQSINRYLPAHSSIDAKLKLKNTFIIAVSFVLMTILGLSALAFPAVNIWLVPWEPYFGAGLLLILATILYNPLLVILQAESRAREYALFTICNALLKLIFGLCIVYYILPQGYGLILGASLSLIILVPIMWRHAGLASPVSLLNVKAIRSHKPELNHYIAYGLPMVAWFLAENILNTGDRYIIELFRGPSEVGIYSANYSLMTGAIGLLTAPVLLVAHPFLMKSWSAGDKQETARWLSSITEWFSNVGVILVGLVWLFSSDLASLILGAEFHRGHTIMPPVMGGIVLWQMAQYIQKPLEFAARTGLMMTLALIAAFAGVVLDICFVPKFGYVAAAWVTFVSYFLYNAMVGYAGRKILPWRIRWHIVILTISILMVIFIAIGSVRMFVQQRLGYAAGLGSTVFWCVVLLTFFIYKNRNLNRLLSSQYN